MYKPNTFSQIIKLIDRKIIDLASKAHKSDRYCKGFTTIKHLCAMLFAQFSGCRSLADLDVAFNSKPSCYYHWGATRLSKSTVSYANQHRKAAVFGHIARTLAATNNKTRAALELMDSTTINVSGRGSAWAKKTKTTFGKGLKIHIRYGNDTQHINDFSITATNVNDITAAYSFEIEEGKIYVFDKGYYDFNWWHQIQEKGSSFVTRIKRNTQYRIVESRDFDKDAEPNIISDQIITLTNKTPRGGKVNMLANHQLRLIVAVNPEDNKQYSFITNLFVEKASSVVTHYKSRWDIELLFKWLKQNLRITHFFGENENAIKVQLYIALIAQMLVNMLKHMGTCGFKRGKDILMWLRINILSRDIKIKPPDAPYTVMKILGQQTYV